MIGSNLENVDDEKKKILVEGACKEAFADEFIHKLPNGYETQVGDAGIKLSGECYSLIFSSKSRANHSQI